jgi:hypothetical protein
MNRDTWKRRLQERPDRPQGRQHRQLDVLLALADLLDARTGTGNVSVLEAAKAAGVGERTARRALAWAVQAGALERSSRGRGRGLADSVASAWRLAASETPCLAASLERLAANSPGLAANSTKAPDTTSARDGGPDDDERAASAAAIAQKHDWSADHAARVVEAVLAKASGPVKNPAAYVLAVIKRRPESWGPDARRWRPKASTGKRAQKKPDKAEVAKFRKWAAKQPPCPDGYPGGDLIGAGGVICPICRDRGDGHLPAEEAST